MEEKTLKVLCGLGIVMIIIGIGMSLYSETKEETVQVVPVPKTEMVTSYPYLVPGCIIGVIGFLILVAGVYQFFHYSSR